jgi:hypothetical protein
VFFVAFCLLVLAFFYGWGFLWRWAAREA